MIIYNSSEISSTPFSKTSIFCYAHLIHGHTFFELTIILDGRCKYMVNGKEPVVLEKGNLFFVRPGDYHRIEALDKNYSHRDFYVTEEKMKKLCSAFSDDFYDKIMDKRFPLVHKLKISDFSSIESKSLLLAQDKITERSDYASLDYLHTSVISQLLGTMIYSSLNQDSKIPLWLSKLYLQIQQFYFIHNTIEEIINTTGYTHGYVCKKFKQYYGMTLLDFHNENKVIFSLSLLGHQKIIDIATLLNWENPKNYTIAFKKVYGISPSQFLKNLQKTAESRDN